MKQKNVPFILAFIFSVLALCLSAYSVFMLTEMKKGGDKDDTFKKDVYAVIDAYIQEKSGQTPPSTEPVDVSVDNDAMKGDKNAPVTMVEFSDYECPFCGRYFTQTYPQIEKNYIETGKVKLVFRDFPLGIHPDAPVAANAAECVREQGGDDMYFKYHDMLFTNQTALGVDKLKEYASSLSIDQKKFAACVDSNKFKDEIDKDIADGTKYGVRGTPDFFINGVPISGAQPYEVFKAAIDKELAK